MNPIEILGPQLRDLGRSIAGPLSLEERLRRAQGSRSLQSLQDSVAATLADQPKSPRLPVVHGPQMPGADLLGLENRNAPPTGLPFDIYGPPAPRDMGFVEEQVLNPPPKPPLDLNAFYQDAQTPAGNSVLDLLGEKPTESSLYPKPKEGAPTTKLKPNSDSEVARAEQQLKRRSDLSMEKLKAKKDDEIKAERLRKLTALRSMSEGFGNIRATTAGEIMMGIAPQETNGYIAENLRAEESKLEDEIGGSKLAQRLREAGFDVPDMPASDLHQSGLAQFAMRRRLQDEDFNQRIALQLAKDDESGALADKEAQSISDMDSLLRELEGVSDLFKETDSSGPIESRIMGAWDTVLGDWAGEGADKRAILQTRLTAVTQIMAKMVEDDRLSDADFRRLSGMLPTMRDDEGIAESKLRDAIRFINERRRDRVKTYEALGKDVTPFKRTTVYSPSAGVTFEGLDAEQLEEARQLYPDLEER